MANELTDIDVVGWLIKGLAALVLFLLSLGVKDIRDRVKASETAALEAIAKMTVLKGKLETIEADIEYIKQEIKEIRERELRELLEKVKK